MGWEVDFDEEFEPEFESLSETVQDELYAHARLLERLGPGLGRPGVDTLRDSKFPNMKELRFNAEGGVWRVAFAFDPKRKAILLVAGNKADLWDREEEKFYKQLIKVADERFEAHLERLKKKDEEEKQKNKKQKSKRR
jgi:hypothetical protein